MVTLREGDVLDRRKLVGIDGELVHLPDPQRRVHLQFRRYAGCPICHLHLRSIASRHEEIRAANVCEVVVFHSSAETMRRYHDDMPYTAIADPERHLYAEFGVTTSPRAFLDPRGWASAMRGVVHQRSLRGAVGDGETHLGLPADFLIDPDGTVLAAKYGAYADDQWSVDELLELAGLGKRERG
ncbi:peroxiredoxin-like family protein [Haloechinothrix sp. LS1_15]|uniref:peroxiredoxin-like family protein n=1 Tax=Haloechinothrix sp. LS1_15 TaxID=2652248 RepID=UPI0029453595|nr:peroxiredoxin-like family protein [Haloechinothrix sp. LS1_15]MDV6013602.1 AhpC/TSA family protein [Haloechinothrix sp. LS1_15]